MAWDRKQRGGREGGTREEEQACICFHVAVARGWGLCHMDYNQKPYGCHTQPKTAPTQAVKTKTNKLGRKPYN